MPARITIKAELQSLLSKSQALTDANRLTLLDAERQLREGRLQLGAKRQQDEAAAERRKKTDDPVGRNRRTAAMGRQRPLEKFEAYYMIEFLAESIRLTLRSGVRATAQTEFYSSVEDSPTYTNQESSATFPRAEIDLSATFIENCPEYAAVIAEVSPLRGSVDVFGSDNSWFTGNGWYRLFAPIAGLDSFNYYESVVTPSGGTVPRTFKVRDVSQIGITDIGYVDETNDFGFTSYQNQDGSNLPRGRFVYVRGYKNTKSYNSGNFTGSVFYLDQTWAIEFGALVNTVIRNELVPATGSWSGDTSVSGPVTAAWLVAESANVPASQSLVTTGVGGLNLEQAFAGNFSSWPGAGGGGTMTQLLPPGGSGGGGPGGPGIE